MIKFIRKLKRDERGISALEYAILAGFILVGVGAALGGTDGIGAKVKNIFGDVNTQLDNADKANDGSGGGNGG